MRKWTAETDREADVLYATFSEAELRTRQDLCGQQIAMAYRDRNDHALEDLRAQEDALTRAMLARL